MLVENFDGYNDSDNRIYDAWVDGFVNGTGAQVGNTTAPFAEQKKVLGGQSMPLFYRNTGAITVSEATRSFDAAQDWTADGRTTLSIGFAGAESNTGGGSVYVKINGQEQAVGVDLTDGTWQTVEVPLADFGDAAFAVTEMTIGVQGAGAQGVVYVDDILVK